MTGVTQKIADRRAKEVRIRVYQKPDDRWQADAEGDHHGEGATRGEALRNLAEYLDFLDAK